MTANHPDHLVEGDLIQRTLFVLSRGGGSQSPLNLTAQVAVGTIYLSASPLHFCISFYVSAIVIIILGGPIFLLLCSTHSLRFSQQALSAVSGLPLSSLTLVPNLNLKLQVQRWRHETGRPPPTPVSEDYSTSPLVARHRTTGVIRFLWLPRELGLLFELGEPSV